MLFVEWASDPRNLIQIVLASMASLEVGFSHDIFVEWASDPRNLVLFTERGQVCARLPYC